MTPTHTHAARWVLTIFALWCLAGQHIFVHHLGGVGLDLPFNAITWLFAGAMLAAGALAVRPVLVTSGLWLCMAAGALVLWLPYFYPHAEATRIQALPRLLGLSAGLLFYLMLQQCRFNAGQRRWLLMWLLVLATVQMLFALVQFFLLPADNWFHFNTKVRLPYGIFMQRNVMSSFVGSAVLLALYLLIVARAGRGHWMMWLWGVAVAVTGIVLVVLLQSRAGLYSLMVGLLLLLPVCWLRLNTRWQRWLLLAMVAVASAAGIMLLLQSDLHRRMLEVYGELGVRHEIWTTTLGLAVQNIWSGVGYGGFEPAYYAEAARLMAQSGAVPQMPGGLHHPHNEVLLWLVEGGIVTLLAWLVWGLGLWRLLAHLPWSERLALVALCLPLLAHLMSEYPFEHSVLHWFWLLVVLYFFDSQYGRGRLLFGVWPWPLGGTMFVAGAALLAFMATGLQTAYQLTHFERGRFSEPARLEAVLNPWFWPERQQLYRYSAKLQSALNENNRAGVEEYLHWSAPLVARLPRVSLLHNHLVALIASGREQEAEALAARLRREYPKVGHYSPASLDNIRTRLKQGTAQIYRHLSQPVGSATYYGNWHYPPQRLD